MSRSNRPENAPRIIVSLGSNLGDSTTLITEAIAQLRKSHGQGFRASSLWRSAPVDCPQDSPTFINAAVLFEATTGETPEQCLSLLQSVEQRFGRAPRRIINEPRRLDLDLISFGGIEQRTARLVLPHPRAHQRRFVLAPLCELNPDIRLPGWTRTAAEYLAALRDHDWVVRIDDGDATPSPSV